METTLLHADVDSFFASVAQRDDPSLRGRPTLVGPGVVMAASYEAKRYGVRGGMNTAQARRLCPQAVIVPASFAAYRDASRALFAIFEGAAPDVEGLSMEEAFLDVRGLEEISGSPEEIAARLRCEVREQVGLPISVGVARNRVLAKMASREAKPDGLLVVPPERELAFLHPIPVERVWGVGAATAAKLHRRGIATVGDAARLPEEALASILGQAGGRRLHAIALGRDTRRLRTGRRRSSIGSQSALGRSPRSAEAIDVTLHALVDRVTRRMRKGGRVGRTVMLRLRFADFSRATRSRTLTRPTAARRTVLAKARELLAASRPAIERHGITLIGVTVSNLERAGAGEQLTLAFDPDDYALDAAIDELRDRFGHDVVTSAALLGRRPARPGPYDGLD